MRYNQVRRSPHDAVPAIVPGDGNAPKRLTVASSVVTGSKHHFHKINHRRSQLTDVVGLLKDHPVHLLLVAAGERIVRRPNH
jgi:hypothetical protein